MNYFDARNYLANIPDINRGGCLVSAYAFQQFCQKNGYKVPTIVALHSWEESVLTRNIQINHKFIATDGRTQAANAAHFGWTYGATIMDAKKTVPLSNYKEKIFIPTHLMPKLYKETMVWGNWNPAFHRFWIPKIAEKLNVNLDF